MPPSPCAFSGVHLGRSCRSNSADSIQSAFSYVRLAIAKRLLRGVDRVVAEDEIVFVRSGRAEDELGSGERREFDRIEKFLD
jgi:hypothetical protein